MNLIKIDSTLCTKCGMCFKSCWNDVFRVDKATRQPYAAYPEDCVECNYCEVSCPVGALTVIIDYAKPMASCYGNK
ncbi:MAG: hypothetical protein H6Q00_2131 [Holophagaceae bacterium]|uniref:4Fe-4S dicluster domain-containing protein n=1 Tax=Holophaga foetida TaxID=35839 RepID=UPI0002472171|nr:ferredoxin family protein [Holophaga foetida]MBP1627656.1 hypothetical protein [Holophagaceae bacterium]